MARPSQPSGTGTLAVTRPDAVSMTETEGGLNPPLRTRRYLPSGERAVDMGRVSRGTWRPAGSRRRPPAVRVGGGGVVGTRGGGGGGTCGGGRGRWTWGGCRGGLGAPPGRGAIRC